MHIRNIFFTVVFLSFGGIGAGYWNAESFTNWGAVGTRNKCPTGLTTIGYGVGADEAGDCGRVLHFGTHKIYMRSNKKTSPALCISDGKQTYYGNIGAGLIGALRVMWCGNVVSIYDDITAAGL